MKSAVHFGAGNIGRGFIGLLLHQAGFRVTFVDVNAATVDAINGRGCYRVQFAAPGTTPIVVGEIDAVHAADAAAVTRAVAAADLVTTAVGPSILRHIAPAIAAGLAAREPGRPAAAVIACENLIGASDLLGRLVREALPPGTVPPAVFANCAVDRIVPLQSPDPIDPLAVTVEPFCEWVIDAAGFTTQPAPVLPGAMFVADLQPYIERKLFTVNTGHAALAYLGYLDGCRFIHEAMARPEIRAVATGALHESGAGLTFRHRFNRREHEDYIKKILARFANALLPDEVVRVARSPLRKLGAAERLVAPARYALAAGVQPDSLARVIAATLRFDFAGDPEAVSLQAWLRDNGPAATLTRCTGLGSDDPLHRLVIAHTPIVPSA